MRIILVSPEERMHSYVIRLKFNTSDHVIDCEALLAGLAISVSKGTDIEEKDEKRSQNDKTGLRMEKQEKTKSKSKTRPEKVNPSQPRSQKSRNISLGT
ncbi:hypothetical protein Tco_0866117 [Tanacetum coccineum]